MRLVETPAIIRGAVITIDSGIFCSDKAEAIVKMLPVFPEEKLTPVARPSGILWRAIAAEKRRIFDLSSAELDESMPAMRWRCGMILSRRLIIKAPVKAPRRGVIKFDDSANAGAIRPSTDAASMMPAANPRTMSFRRCGIFENAKPHRTPKIEELPMAVRTIANMEISKGILFSFLLHNGILPKIIFSAYAARFGDALEWAYVL